MTCSHVDVTVEDFAEESTAEIVVFLVKQVEREGTENDAGRTFIDTVIIESAYDGDVQAKKLTELVTPQGMIASSELAPGDGDDEVQTDNAQDQFVTTASNRSYQVSDEDFAAGNYGRILFPEFVDLMNPSTFIAKAFTNANEGGSICTYSICWRATC